jgi:hypothetical protein
LLRRFENLPCNLFPTAQVVGAAKAIFGKDKVMSEILQANTPLEFEGRNIRTPKRSSSLNDLYLVQFEISREAWEALETVPKSAMLGGLLYWIDGDEHNQAPVNEEDEIIIQIKKPTKKDMAKPKGEWGKFWTRMIANGAVDKQQFFNHPDLHQVLGLEAPVSLEQAKAALYQVFGVNSLSFVSPKQFSEWCTENELHSLAALANKLAFQ